MGKAIELFAKKKKYLWLLVVYGLITAAIFWHRLPDIATRYGMPDVDTDGAIWYFWARLFAWRDHFDFTFSNHFFSYPFGYDFNYIPFFSLVYEIEIWVARFLGGSWQDIILVSNLAALAAYPLTAVSTYALAHYLTKNRYASFLAGLIFAFSYYFILMGRGSLAQNQLELIPLYFLSLFYFLDNKRWKPLIISGFMFALLFAANSYWAFFAGIFSVVFVLPELTDKKNIIMIIKYFLFMLMITFAVNYKFVLANIYTFNNSALAQSGKVSVAEDQVVDITSFFLPSDESLYPIRSNGNNFLGFAALLIAFSGFWVLRGNKRFNLFFVCIALSIVLASNIKGLFWINELYFKFFGMFRSVSRLNIFTTLFLSLAASYVVSELYNRRNDFWRRHGKILFAIFLLVCSWVIFDGLNQDRTWWKRADFSKVAKLYSPIKNNREIKAVAGYPMNLSNGTDGFPQNYERLGQTIHEKPLASGASPFMPLALENYEKISDITAADTISVLADNGVNGIAIYDRLLDDSDIVINRLKHDKRLEYLGHYEVESDNDQYISQGELARSYYLFLIR